jgi:dephospho-CoA kinase
MNAVNSSRRCLSIQQGLFKPIQIGLTGIIVDNILSVFCSYLKIGSIGMGKSSVAKHFNNLGFPVFDADSAVHELYSKDGEAVYPLSKIVPDAIVDSSVDRKILGMKILQNDRLLKDIEEIVHPLVAKKRNLFLEACRSKGCFLVVYDIPLLLENVQNYSVDYIVVVSASAETQRSRVLSRPGMTIEKFESILSKQMPDHEKQKRAHFVISTDYPDYASARSQICKIIESIVKEKYDIWTQFLSNCNYYHNNKVIIKRK